MFAIANYQTQIVVFAPANYAVSICCLHLHIPFFITTFASQTQFSKANTAMDSSFQSIITRLQTFVDQTGMTMSQFADFCGIPRPTLSQLFSGRTKSINDVMLARLASAFPRLSVAWLLFGRGNMLEAADIETSEAQTGLFAPQSEDLSTDSQPDNASQNSPAPNSGERSVCEDSFLEAGSIEAHDSFVPEIPYTAPPEDRTRIAHRDESANNAVGTGRPGRKAVKIVVLYSDGTFEAFAASEPERG